MDLTDKVLSFATGQKMFAPGEKVLVAVSGGPDSVALLDILFRIKDQLKISLHVAHLDHRLRGAESRKDAQFVRELSSKLDLPATVEQRDVAGFVREHGLSQEEGARAVRYRFLEEVAQRAGATKIATGHNLDDQAETILFRLLRGSGARGLGGIPPVRDNLFVRPLLKTTRREIEDYVADRCLSTRHDSSNDEICYMRNRIRHELLPLLKESYNPKIVTVLDRISEILRAEDEFLDEETTKALPKIIKNRLKRGIILDIPGLLSYHISLRRRILMEVLYLLSGGDVCLEFKQVESLIRLASSKSGVVQITPQIRAQKWGDLLVLKQDKIPSFQKDVEIPGIVDVGELSARLLTEVFPRQELVGEDWRFDPQVAAFDLDSIRGGLQLRSLRLGDAFQPLGMRGHKKVSDFLIDRKVPRILRDEIPVLTDQERILWVVGLDISEACKVTPQTREVLKAQFQIEDGGWGKLK